ncbi:MAG: class I SAM-dependent methyltransferase [Gracilibacteraceae bacterium]|jgi:SAM-dependent methyltransferase|nr:class I SAM-dependent methyltransferase [Gracilibacteraceae bacterium]
MSSLDSLAKWLQKYQNIWLFGTGAYGQALRECLCERNVGVRGFIVSSPEFDHMQAGEPIISIDEFKNTFFLQNTGVVLAVDCKYYNDIIPKLSFALDNLYFLDEEFKQACWDWYYEKYGPNNPYDSEFYEKNLKTQAASANGLLQVITTFINPRSVIDVGCGIGLIVRKFKEYGAKEVFGLDGAYVDRTRLRLEDECFIPHDLTKPYKSERRYDLALSLEVAEHLGENHARQFVATLCGLSDTIVFSAAVPGQGGDQHINEKPQSYWANLFADNGYKAVDCIRPLIWDNPEVSDYYKQNIILYIKRSAKGCGAIDEYVQKPILDIIHPDLFGRIAAGRKNK